MAAKDAVGRYGEKIAVRYLERQGFSVLERRWRCRHGEIDVIAMDGGCLVVVEVKTRRSLATGPPEAAVTQAKLGRLRLLTGAWLCQQEVPWQAVRIDIVAVVLPRAGAASVTHFRGAG